MKYSDMKVNFDAPKIWRYEPKANGGGRTFSELMLERDTFTKLKNSLKNDIHKMVDGAIDDSQTEEQLGVLLDPIFERLHKSFFCSETINEDLLLKKANRNTLNKKLQDWCRQLNQNCLLVREKPGTKIFYDKFKGVPCVVVAAGPSLANSIERIRKIKDRALIMAVDTSFRSLTKRGIDPHFVNAHDANANGARFFDGIDTEAVALFVNYVNPLTIGAFRGPICFYYVEDPSIPTYELMARACDSPNRKDGTFMDSKVPGGSSVAHTALYLAMLLGCNPITFVGLDLSYPDLDKSHFETNNPKSVRGQKLVDVEDLQGRKIKTNLSFLSYKSVFEKMAGLMAFMFNTRIFTSSEDEQGRPAGIVHAGLEPLPFDDFIATYANKEREELKTIQKEYKKYG